MSAHTRPSAHIWTLRLLLTIFVVRVVAQPLSAWLGAEYLPPFDAWHSGVLPYAVLVISQLAIVAGAYLLIRGLASGGARPRRGVGQVVLTAGSVYGAVMLARLLLGATVLSGHPWFARQLPDDRNDERPIGPRGPPMCRRCARSRRRASPTA